MIRTTECLGITKTQPDDSQTMEVNQLPEQELPSYRKLPSVDIFNKKSLNQERFYIIKKVIKLIRRSGVQFTNEEKEGEVVDQIIKKADKNKIIVMKASNMSPIKRYFKGSVPLSVMNESDVPILIVK